MDVLGAAVGLIEDFPRERALQMLRERAHAMHEWRTSITSQLPADPDLDAWGPIGEVLSLWLTTADTGAQWTHRLIRRLEEGAMAASSAPEEEAASSKLTTTLHRAVVMGDSHGKHVRAAQILDSALERDKDTATAAELLETLAYRAELALRAEDPAAAADDALARARAITLSQAERDKLADILAALEDMEAILRPAQRP
ncbi:hypothetical protein AB0J35_48135 [Nonomuraea angiospora]|uniref:hypothetical protein n=1 Tax=Nonomuraea angiospora TaxID=46172 RepID=UPI0034200660